MLPLASSPGMNFTPEKCSAISNGSNEKSGGISTITNHGTTTAPRPPLGGMDGDLVRTYDQKTAGTPDKMKFFHTFLAPILGLVLSQNARAGGILGDPIVLFPNSFLPVLSRFEKAKIETTLRGFYLRADTFPGIKEEHEPSDAGLYLNVAVRDPEEILKFKDSSKTDGEITERMVEFPELKNGEVALRIVFTFGSHANPDAIKAISNDIESAIKQVNTTVLAVEKLMDDKLAVNAEVVLRVKRLTGGEGSKYWWFQVQVLQVLKNQSRRYFPRHLT